MEKGKTVKAWGIFTKEGSLCWTDREACIYSDYSTALKEKGSQEIRAVEIYIREVQR